MEEDTGGIEYRSQLSPSHLPQTSVHSVLSVNPISIYILLTLVIKWENLLKVSLNLQDTVLRGLIVQALDLFCSEIGQNNKSISW
jgi:hypothetical protein